MFGCASSKSPLPPSEHNLAPIKTEVYAGSARAYQFSAGSWERNPSYDYEFVALRRTLGDGWETIKDIHRRHPDYDGRAGARDQTLYFRVVLSPAADGSARLGIESPWGKGTGRADAGMKNVVVEFAPHISRFAPFNSYRITQRLFQEEGKLRETIELFKRKDGLEVQFMKMEEEADIFVPMKK